MFKNAVISKCEQYRYELTRRWENDAKSVLFIGLNPSDADDKIDDPTMRRCIDFASNWGYGELKMVNLFAYRDSDPNVMKKQANPIGDKNDEYILALAKNADLVVVCWGNDGSYLDRSFSVSKLLEPISYKIKCFGYNLGGQPKHPLYLAKTTELID